MAALEAHGSVLIGAWEVWIGPEAGCGVYQIRQFESLAAWEQHRERVHRDEELNERYRSGLSHNNDFVETAIVKCADGAPSLAREWAAVDAVRGKPRGFFEQRILYFRPDTSAAHHRFYFDHLAPALEREGATLEGAVKLLDSTRHVSLVPFSGIQFLDFGFNHETLPKVTRRFHEMQTPDGLGLVSLETDPETGEPLDPTTRKPIAEEDTYACSFRDTIGIFLNKWVPLPVFRLLGLDAEGVEFLALGADAAASDTSAASCAATAWRILNLLIAAATLRTDLASRPIAERLARGTSGDRPPRNSKRTILNWAEKTAAVASAAATDAPVAG
jgi:hypothetical protein